MLWSKYHTVHNLRHLVFDQGDCPKPGHLESENFQYLLRDNEWKCKVPGQRENMSLYAEQTLAKYLLNK